jgi:hypothetical protein
VHRPDAVRIERSLLQLGAQAFDGAVDGACILGEVVVPDLFEQLLVGLHTPAASQQQVQQVEFQPTVTLRRSGSMRRL